MTRQSWTKAPGSPRTEITGAELGGWLDQGTFVAFLGHDCGRYDIESSAAWVSVANRVVACAKVADAPYRRYFLKLAQAKGVFGQHRRDTGAGRLAGFPEDVESRAVEDKDEDPELLELTAILARLASLATSLFAGSVQADNPAVFVWETHAATTSSFVTNGADEAEPAVEAMLAAPPRLKTELFTATLEIAVKMAAQLSARSEAIDRTPFEEDLKQLLGAAGVARHLESIQRQLVTGDGDSHSVTITGEAVEWLTELVWHCLRFDQG